MDEQCLWRGSKERGKQEAPALACVALAAWEISSIENCLANDIFKVEKEREKNYFFILSNLWRCELPDLFEDSFSAPSPQVLSKNFSSLPRESRSVRTLRIFRITSLSWEL